MVVTERTPLDEHLLRELREEARRGALITQLVSHFRRPSESHPAVIPMLAYLCRAFWVTLPVALPLREDEGEGAFGRAIQVAFWFSALVTEGVTPEPWSWDRFWADFGQDFTADRMEQYEAKEGQVQIARSSEAIFVRGLVEFLIDKQASYGPSEAEVSSRLRVFASAFREALRIENTANGAWVGLPLKLEHQIEDQGPKYRVVCMARALRTAAIPMTA